MCTQGAKLEDFLVIVAIFQLATFLQLAMLCKTTIKFTKLFATLHKKYMLQTVNAGAADDIQLSSTFLLE